MVRCRLKLRHKTPRAVELRFSGDLTGITGHNAELLNNVRNVALPVGFHTGQHPQGRSTRFSDRLPQRRRNKTPRKWLHGGYMAPKTEKACRSFLKQQAFVFIGGAEVTSSQTALVSQGQVDQALGALFIIRNVNTSN